MVTVALGYYCFFANPQESADGTYIDPNAKAWNSALAAPKTDSNSIQVPGYDTVTMGSDDTTLNISVGNPEGNQYYLKATLMLADGTVLFESGLLEPGMGYESVPLSGQLAPGEYEAMVNYQGFTMDNKKTPVNSADSVFTLVVQ